MSAHNAIAIIAKIVCSQVLAATTNDEKVHGFDVRWYSIVSDLQWGL